MKLCFVLQESKTSQLLSQLLYDAVAHEKLQVLALQIALHQVCFWSAVDISNDIRLLCVVDICDYCNLRMLSGIFLAVTPQNFVQIRFYMRSSYMSNLNNVCVF